MWLYCITIIFYQQFCVALECPMVRKLLQHIFGHKICHTDLKKQIILVLNCWMLTRIISFSIWWSWDHLKCDLGRNKYQSNHVISCKLILLTREPWNTDRLILAWGCDSLNHSVCRWINENCLSTTNHCIFISLNQSLEDWHEYCEYPKKVTNHK